MVESTIDKIKDTTVERQIRKLAGVVDEYTEAISELQNKDAAQDNTLTEHATLIQGITESLVSDVEIMPGTTTGDIKIRLEREKAAVIDSNNYNLGLPVSAEIIQGTGPSMFKIQLTMSTGVKVISNDFVFTTETIGSDVYISSFTFKAGNQDGYLSADIGLNNGVTIEANNFLVPTDPNIISEINDLNTRVSAIEGGSGLNELKAAVANLQTNKADVDNSNQNITVNSIIGKSLYAKTDNTSGYAVIVNNVPNDENTPIRIISQIDSNGSPVGLTTGYVAMLDATGKPKNFTAGGSTVIECPLNYQEFFSSLQLGSEIYGDRLDFSNNDTDTIASFYNFNLKCVTNNTTDGVYIIGQAYKTQMVLGNNTTLYRNSVTIVFKSGKVTITVEGGTNETASTSIVVKRSQFLPMSTINTNVFIRV